MQRKLVAILAADIVGFSQMMADDDVGTLTALKTQQKSLLEPMVTQHGGRIFKEMGDGTLAEFGSVVEAVKCAVALQTALTGENGGSAPNLTLRIGINLGDVIVENGDLFGDGVNIATRLEQTAKPGGICISASAYDQVKDKLDISYRDIGEQRLKGLILPIRAYTIEPPYAGKAGKRTNGTRRREAADTAQQSRPTIAILPFENLSEDRGQDFFCDGLTRDLTADLSRYANLFVIAPHSAFAYRGKDFAAQEIGRQLGVRYLLEGSVERTREIIRIGIHLIDANDDHQLWAHRLQVRGEDLATASEELTQHIVTMLAVRIDAAERNRVLKKSTTNLSAYECYLMGVHCYSHDTAESLSNCRSFFEKASQLDPDFARAWGYLAYLTMRAVIHGWADPAAEKVAVDFAKKAMKLDPYDYSNHWDMAFVLWNIRSFDLAMEEYRRALALNPNDADLVAEYGDTLTYWGTPQDAIIELKRAMKINPLYPDWYRWNLAFALFSVQAYEESLQELARISEPHNNVHLIIAANHIRLGNGDNARAPINEFLKLEPDYTIGKLRRRTAFRIPKDEEHWLGAVREAGLGD